MQLRELIVSCRSYRRFHQDVPVDLETLKELVDLARLSASAGNRQPLKFILSFTDKKNGLVFPRLAWAGYLKGWEGPGEGERPAAYILICGDRTISESIDCDHGIAAQSIVLGAAEKGLGACIIGSIDREGLGKDLGIAPRYETLLVIALGRPKERVVIEPLGKKGDIRYWRDSKGVHHVPKRALEDIIAG